MPHEILVLPDGRRLAYALYGHPGGAPVFYQHGLPGDSDEAAATVDAAARACGVQIVAAARPGYGHSDPLPGRSYSAWPADVRALADHLGLPRFSVFGYSGGGAFALACAARLPDRVARVAVMCGLGPMAGAGGVRYDQVPWYHPQRLMLGLAARAPWMAVLPVRWIASAGRRDPEFLLSRMSAGDQAVAARPEVRVWLENLFRGPLRQGDAACIHEIQSCVRPWDFALADVRVPVQLHAGAEDRNCPPAMARAQAAAIARAQVFVHEGVGHFAIFEHARAALGWLAEEPGAEERAVSDHADRAPT